MIRANACNPASSQLHQALTDRAGSEQLQPWAVVTSGLSELNAPFWLGPSTTERADRTRRGKACSFELPPAPEALAQHTCDDEYSPPARRRDESKR
jgi:hypothetical protein